MHIVYFLRLANIAFFASGDTIRICCPQFFEIVDSMDTGAIFRGLQPGNVGGKIRYWSGRRGSNPQPTAWEAATLPLSYSRFDTNYTAEERSSIESIDRSRLSKRGSLSLILRKPAFVESCHREPDEARSAPCATFAFRSLEVSPSDGGQSFSTRV